MPINSWTRLKYHLWRVLIYLMISFAQANKIYWQSHLWQRIIQFSLPQLVLRIASARCIYPSEHSDVCSPSPTCLLPISSNKFTQFFRESAKVKSRLRVTLVTFLLYRRFPNRRGDTHRPPRMRQSEWVRTPMLVQSLDRPCLLLLKHNNSTHTFIYI